MREGVLQERTAGTYASPGQAAFPILDEYEEDDWEWGEAEKDPLDDQTAAARDAGYLARLLLACENDLEVLTDVIQVWYESRRNPSTPAGTKIERAISFGRFSAS